MSSLQHKSLFLPLLAAAVLLTVTTPAQARYTEGMNLYAYVDSRPMEHVDPRGQSSVNTQTLPGWYKKKTPGAFGQTRVCFKIETKPCVCKEYSKKKKGFHIEEVNVQIRLAITLDEDAKTKHSKAGVYGHEKRHVTMMTKALEKHRASLEKKLKSLESKSYKTKPACEKSRKNVGPAQASLGKAISRIAKGWTVKKNGRNPKKIKGALEHATSKDEENAGYPRRSKEYDRDKPAGDSKGDGLPLKKEEGWICNPAHSG